jgi:hypothetical protein
MGLCPVAINFSLADGASFYGPTKGKSRRSLDLGKGRLRNNSWIGLENPEQVFKGRVRIPWALTVIVETFGNQGKRPLT